MLKHQMQATNECVPTSIAMLLDIPRQDVILAALPDGCRDWQTLHTNPGQWWQTVILLLDTAFGNGTGGKYFMLAARNAKLNLTSCPPGKGLMSVFHPKQAMGHCVAYSDGIIHDPEFPVPFPWGAWRRLYQDWHIRGVVEVK